LTRYGIACYAYDQRGFGGAPGTGLWSGVDAYTNDLSSFVKVIRKLHPDVPLYIMGESMGGAVTIVALTGKSPPPIDGVILVAPAVWARETMPWYQRWLLAVTSHTVPWMELDGSGFGITPSDNIEMRKSLYNDPLVIKGTRVDAMYGLTNLMDEALAQAGMLQLPALILYGKKDQVIPKEPVFRMLEKRPSTTRKAFYEQGYHMLLRDLYREKPLIDIATWISDHNKPLIYGTANWY
jgi:alpha-beta hydrolase superfamily lysophospholipase